MTKTTARTPPTTPPMIPALEVAEEADAGGRVVAVGVALLADTKNPVATAADDAEFRMGSSLSFGEVDSEGTFVVLDVALLEDEGD